MDSTPPPHTSSFASSAAAAAASLAGQSSSLSSSSSPRGSQSAALLRPPTMHTNSQLRSSLYPPPPPGRLASRGALASSSSNSGAAGSSSSSRPRRRPSPPGGAGVASFVYDELCSIRRSSAEYIAHLEAAAEAHRAATARPRPTPPPLHHRAPRLPSGTPGGLLPPLPGGSGTFSRYHAPSSPSLHQQQPPFATAAFGRPPLPPRGGFSSGPLPSASWQQLLAWPPSSASGRLDLPSGNFSEHPMSLSQVQQALQSFPTSSMTDLPVGSVSAGAAGYAPSFPPQLHQARPWSSATTTGLPNNLPGGSFASGQSPFFPPQQLQQPAWPSSATSAFGNASPSLLGQQQQQMLQQAGWSSTSGLPPLPESLSTHAPSSSQQQQQQNAYAWPPSSSATSSVQQQGLPSGSFFGNASASLQLHQQQQAGSSSASSGLPHLSGGFATFPQSSSAPASHHQQNPWHSATTCAGSSSSSSANEDLPASSSGSNTTTGTGLVQPSSTSTSEQQYELPPLPPSLHIPLLPVKQEPVQSSGPLEPELVYIDEEISAGLDELMRSMDASSPGPEGPDQQLQSSSSGLPSSWGAAASGGQSWSSSPMPEQVVRAFDMMSIDDAGTTSGGGSMAWNNSHSSMLMPMPQQQQVPWQMGQTFSSWPSHSDTPGGFVQPTPASHELPPLPPSLQMASLSLMDSNSSRGLVQYGSGGIGPSNWNAPGTGSNAQNWGGIQESARSGNNGAGSTTISARGKMPWQCDSSSTQTSITVLKLRLGGMESPRVLPPLPSRVTATSSSSVSRTGFNRNLFTDAEMETIMKDKRLKTLVDTDPKRVKRIILNRACAARIKAQKDNCLRDLEHQFEALQLETIHLSSQVRSEQDKFVELKSQNQVMGMRLQQLEAQAKMNEAQTEALRAEIESYKPATDLS